MHGEDRVVLSETESVCPECLSRIPAFKVAEGRNVFLRKTCPDHGEFNVVLWRGEPSHTEWVRPKIPSFPSAPETRREQGCPFDCGLCPDHRQQTCTALLEVTQRCDLRCSYCFADSGAAGAVDPGLSVVRSWYEAALRAGHPCNIQLSGGEPTLRDDLPEIVALGREMGFPFVQVNTNGLRLARDPWFVERLKEAGAASVFLQFDGTDDSIYDTLRHSRLLRTKLEAIDNCMRQELAVVLVPTVVPGVNANALGDIIRFAIENLSVVRGVHFQPVSYFGRYPRPPLDADRLTLPELIRSVEEQTSGLIAAACFKPPGCENALCSFHGNFVVMPDGAAVALTRHEPSNSCCRPLKAEEGAVKTRAFVSKHWAAPGASPTSEEGTELSLGEWSVLLERARTHMLCISGMCFQDAWNLDLERLRDCCIHVVSADGRLIPFCAYNLTDSDGRSPYRTGP